MFNFCQAIFCMCGRVSLTLFAHTVKSMLIENALFLMPVVQLNTLGPKLSL